MTTLNNFYFFISELMINSILSAAGKCGFHLSSYSPGFILTQSVFLSSTIYATFWCIRAFFAASVLSYLNGKYHVCTLGIAIEVLFLYALGLTWTAICMIGGLCSNLMKEDWCKELFKNKTVRILILTIIFFAIKRPEGRATYLIDGICSGRLLLTILNSKFLKKVLDIFPLHTAAGRMSMAIFMIHPLVYTIVGNYVFNSIEVPDSHYKWVFLLAYAASWACIMILSIPITYLMNAIMRRFSGVLNWMNKKLSVEGTKEYLTEASN